MSGPRASGADLENLDQDVRAAVAQAWAAVLAGDLDAFNAALTDIQLRHSDIGLVSTLVDLVNRARPVLAERWGLADPASVGVRFRDAADREAAPISGPIASRFIYAALAYDRGAAIDAFVTFQCRNQIGPCWIGAGDGCTASSTTTRRQTPGNPDRPFRR